MALQLIAGSGASHPDGTLTCTMKDLRSGSHVSLAITSDAVGQLQGDSGNFAILEQYHCLLEQTASKKYDDTWQPRYLKLTDTDFFGG